MSAWKYVIEYSSAALRLYQLSWITSQQYRIEGAEWEILTWNLLMAWRPLQIIVWTSDRHEALQNVPVQHAFGVFGRLVAHESIDECEGGLRHFNAAEGQI